MKQAQHLIVCFKADETVTWSLGESADKDKFAIDETGALSFVEAPDYETQLK